MDQGNSLKNSTENIQVLQEGFSQTILKILPSAKSKTSPTLKSPLLRLKLPDLFPSNPLLKDKLEPNRQTWCSILNPSLFLSFSIKPKTMNSAIAILTIQ